MYHYRETLRRLCTHFKGVGLSSEHAYAVAEELMFAEITGRHRHGFELIDALTRRAAKTALIPIDAETPWPAVCLVRASEHVGPVVAAEAVARARSAADAVGLGLAAAMSKSTFLTAGFYPYKLALTGSYVSIAMNVAKARVAPYGTTTAILGSNPLGIGIPGREGPMVLDIAMTPIPIFEVRRAAREGCQLREDMAYDEDGNATVDPNKALRGGAMKTFDGYKGSGLAMMIEALVGGMLGAKCGLRHGDMRGMVFLVIRADSYVAREQVQRWVGDLQHDIKNSKSIDPASPPRTPGSRTHELMTKAKDNGFELTATAASVLNTLDGG